MGKLIAIDGVDASGKETQTELLYQRLVKEGYKVRRVSFPAYDRDSSVLVKEYLSGKYGTKPEDVNAYAASLLFAVDRFSSYRTDWEEDYNNETIILADRYVTSNMIHQAGKLADKNEKPEFINWLYDIEYEKLGIPKPDAVVFLDMPTDFAVQLMANRNNKISGEAEKDIHENNKEYLEKSYMNAVEIAEMSGWNRVRCVENDTILSIEDIHEKVYNSVKEILK